MGILAALKHKADAANRADAKNDRRYTRPGGDAVSTTTAAFTTSADDPTHQLPRISRAAEPR